MALAWYLHKKQCLYCPPQRPLIQLNYISLSGFMAHADLFSQNCPHFATPSYYGVHAPYPFETHLKVSSSGSFMAHTKLFAQVVMPTYPLALCPLIQLTSSTPPDAPPHTLSPPQPHLKVSSSGSFMAHTELFAQKVMRR